MEFINGKLVLEEEEYAYMFIYVCNYYAQSVRESGGPLDYKSCCGLFLKKMVDTIPGYELPTEEKVKFWEDIKAGTPFVMSPGPMHPSRRKQ